jgi:chloramphenicol-sensitive protein RarD
VNRGLTYGVLAYLLWGAFPLYFKALQSIPALEILGHRIVWSLVFVLVLLAARHRWAWLRQVADQPRMLTTFALSALMVSINWGVYILSVASGRIVDASLGYFINPLVSVLLGTVVLRERLRVMQWVAVGIAAAGVGWLTFRAGHVPWIGLTLAFSFGLYGLLRKTAPLASLEGLGVETCLLLPLAVAYLGWLGVTGQAAAPDAAPETWLLLLAAGPVTAAPLLLFAAAARRISLATLGVVQYLGPTLQLLLAVYLYGEAFGVAKVIGYGAIWLALAVYTLDGLRRNWRRRR